MIDLKLGDCLELLKDLEDNSVDAIITDPPYGVLKGHKIETNVDINAFHKEVYRVLKDKGFYVFFGLQPSLTYWISDALQSFKFIQEVIWNKIIPSSFLQPIMRIHENIVILSKNGSNKNLNVLKIDREKNLDELSIESIKRDYALMRQIFNSKEHLQDCLSKLENGFAFNSKEKGRVNDIYYNVKLSQNPSMLDRKIMIIKDGIKPKSIFKFKPHNRIGFNKDEFNVKHPTVKPIALMELLIKLTTNENAIVLDPFMGSGSTGLACKNLNRNFIGFEIHQDYFEIAQNRIFKEVEKSNQAELAC